jgi:Ni/Co efflux regulator RcnB
MRKTMIVGLLLAATAATPAAAQGMQQWLERTQARENRQESRENRAEVRRDRREVQQDRREVARDWRQGERAEARRDTRELRQDQRELRSDRREALRDRQAVREGQAQAPAERQRDWRQERNDNRGDWRDNRQDRREDWRDRRDGDRNWGNRDANRDRASRNDGRWHRDWRNDRRYDWRWHRDNNRHIYRLPRYYEPRGYSYGYRRWSPGYRIPPYYYGRSYWILDPWEYRLPPAYGNYRWVRYFDDALLIDIRTGLVADIIYSFFW